MSRSTRAPRIFLGPIEVSGYYANLESGFRHSGTVARLVTLHPHPFGFSQAQPNPWPARLTQLWVRAHRRVPAALKVVTGGLYVVSSLLVLLWTLPRFDTYIFTWGQSLLPRNVDLPFLRALRKNVIVVIGHGSEARPPYMATAETSRPWGDRDTDALARQTRAVARHVRMIERWASITIALPATAQFLTRPFVNFYTLGIPTPASAPVTDPDSISSDDLITVLHVPSKPMVKGSALIRDAVEAVRLRHPSIVYREITGRPHSEVLAAIAECDLVIDQLWSDIPMAVVGTEAAALGKPTIIGGYAWDEWAGWLSPDDWPPTITSAPNDLADTLAAAIDDLPATRLLGRRAAEFVIGRWSPRSVADRYLALIADGPAASTVVDPAEVLYAWGCGVSSEDILERVESLIARHGMAALEWPRGEAVYARAINRE